MPRGRIYSQWPTVFRPPTDGVTALQFQQADGTPFIYVDTTNKRMGWGTPAPATQAHIAESSTASPRGFMSSQHSDGTDGARLHMRKSRGTNASPTVIVTGDTLGKLVASGYDGANYLEMGAISIEAEGTIASTRVPTRIVFSTATDAAPSVLTERMRIDSAGRIGMAYAPTSPYVLTVGGKIYSTDLIYAGNGFYGNSMTTRNFQNSPIIMDITNGYSFIVKINNAETGRFNSDGNFLIGTTTSSAKLYAYSNDVVAQPVLKVYQDNASNTNAVAVITGDGTGDLLQCFDGATQVFTVKDGGGAELITSVYVEAAGGSLTAAKCSNTLINNYGQADDITYALPAAAKGLAFDFIAGTTVAKYVRFDPNGSEVIYLNGTALAGGAYIGIASIATGMQVKFRCFQTGASSYAWRATTLDAFASE